MSSNTGRGWSAVLAVGLVMGGAGCSARSKLVVAEAPSVNLRTFSTLSVSVESATAEPLDKETAALAAETISRVKNRGVFQDVRLGSANESAPGTLVLKASVSRVKKVGRMKRALAGAFAGRASLTVQVRLVDAASGRELGTYTVVGQSGGLGVSGGTDDAVSKAAEQIAAIVS